MSGTRTEEENNPDSPDTDRRATPRITRRKGCPFCKLFFLTESLLFRHLIDCQHADAIRLRSQVMPDAYSTGSRRLGCNICNEYFRSAWYLIQHRVWYHRELCDDIVDRLLQLDWTNDDGRHIPSPDEGQRIPSLRERFCNFILNPPSDYNLLSSLNEQRATTRT